MAWKHGSDMLACQPRKHPAGRNVGCTHALTLGWALGCLSDQIRFKVLECLVFLLLSPKFIYVNSRPLSSSYTFCFDQYTHKCLSNAMALNLVIGQNHLGELLKYTGS